MLPERIACFRTSIHIEARPELVVGLAARCSWTKLKMCRKHHETMIMSWDSWGVNCFGLIRESKYG